MSFFSFEERKPDIVPDSSRAVKPSVENTTKAEPAASSESQNLSVVGSSSASVESVSSSSVMRISSSAPAVGSSQSTVSVTPYSEDYCSSSAAGAGYEQYQVTAGTSYAGAADTYGSATGPYNYVTTSEMAATYYGTQVATAGSEYVSTCTLTVFPLVLTISVTIIYLFSDFVQSTRYIKQKDTSLLQGFST